MDKKCLFCEKEIEDFSQAQNKKFCSSKCLERGSDKSFPVQKCVTCGKEIVGKRRGTSHCSRECYQKKYKEDHQQNWQNTINKDGKIETGRKRGNVEGNGDKLRLENL